MEASAFISPYSLDKLTVERDDETVRYVEASGGLLADSLDDGASVLYELEVEIN